MKRLQPFRHRSLARGFSPHTGPPARVLRTAAVAAAVLLAGRAAAQGGGDPAASDAPPIDYRDKSDFTLLNPTPRELRRPLSADRPDATESPYTVDAGAAQLEMSFFDYTKNGDLDRLAIAPFNFKLGLLNNTDIQFVLDPYVDVDGDGMSAEGLGDFQIRLKTNIWGNDGGDTAFAIMPFITLPTAADDIGSGHVEGGIILPFSVDLAEGLGLGLMFEADFIYDDADDDYDTEFIGTAVLGVDVSAALGWYVEGIAIQSTDADAQFQAIVGTGVTYEVEHDVVLDAGVNLGLTGDADDVNVFAGMTIRF